MKRCVSFVLGVVCLVMVALYGVALALPPGGGGQTEQLTVLQTRWEHCVWESVLGVTTHGCIEEVDVWHSATSARNVSFDPYVWGYDQNEEAEVELMHIGTDSATVQPYTVEHLAVSNTDYGTWYASPYFPYSFQVTSEDGGTSMNVTWDSATGADVLHLRNLHLLEMDYGGSNTPVVNLAVPAGSSFASGTQIRFWCDWLWQVDQISLPLGHTYHNDGFQVWIAIYNDETSEWEWLGSSALASHTGEGDLWGAEGGKEAFLVLQNLSKYLRTDGQNRQYWSFMAFLLDEEGDYTIDTSPELHIFKNP